LQHKHALTAYRVLPLCKDYQRLFADEALMSKKQSQWNDRESESVSNDAFDRRDPPLKRLEDTVREYHQPFEPVGLSDWEAILLKDLTPDTAHADVLATPTLKEFGEDSDSER
jgi:hypothetical protein